MPYQTIELVIEDRVATLTLNRPKVLNALNQAMLGELSEAFATLAADDSVRVVVLRGAGAKAFAAGADIAELAEANAAQCQQMAESAQRVFRRIATLGKPVLAMLDGFALGGGCELAMACTLRLASPAARLGQPEIKLGLIPGYGGTQRLPRLVGRGAALKMLLTGAIIDATEALRIGLVDEVVPADSLDARAAELAALLASMPPLAIAAVLDAVDRGVDLPLDQALALEASLFGGLSATDDKREGTHAFLEKRTPHWSGH